MKAVKAFVFALILALPACSQPNTPAGWTPRYRCGQQGNCWFVGSTPDGGHWLGFWIGMSHESAIRAACSAILRHQLSLHGYPISERDGRCIVDPAARDQKTAVYDDWSAEADGFSCPVMGYVIDFEFAQKDGRLAEMVAYCHPLDP